jgi:hypothetical protein
MESRRKRIAEFATSHLRQKWLFWTSQAVIGCICLYLWFHLPAPGWSVAILAFDAALMSIHEHPIICEKLVWIAVVGALLVLELKSITKDHADQTATFQGIANGIKKTSDTGDQIIAILEKQSRSQASPQEHQEALVKAWGKASELDTKAVQGATATAQQPSQIQQGKRFVSAEALGLALKDQEHSAATVINDGTNEAGNFASQLEIGLQDAGWQVGGNNIKIGDPQFFPDSLTVEVSKNPASPEDHSVDEAKNLIEALKKQGVMATLRFTTLAFPPNFMRIKVAGQ